MEYHTSFELYASKSNHLNMFDCDQCGKSYKWKDSLIRHKKTEHGQIPAKVRKFADKDDEDFEPLTRSNAVPDNWNPNEEEPESLQRSDGIPVTTVSKRNLFSHQALAPRAQPFKFKHPFCMLVAGPTQSGKTQWTVKFLKERHQRIEPPIDGILFCYAQWQDKYDTLKREVPTTQFHKGIPTSETLRHLRNGILVLDDLMDAAVKDQNIMNMFTVGSHHRNISVLFLMQNLFEKGRHARTISTNLQYMVLFKNARDQTQIRTLAMQVFPTDWRNFLKYYEEETNKEYGHVILDLHPHTRSHERIVKSYTPGSEPSAKPVLNQQFNLMNPYGAQLAKLQEKINDLMQNPSIPDQQKVAEHVEMMNEFRLLQQKYRDNESGSVPPIQSLSKPLEINSAALRQPIEINTPKQYVARLDTSELPEQDVVTQETPKPDSAFFPTPPMSHRPPGLPELQKQDLEPWKVPLPPGSDSDLSSDDDGFGDTRPLSYSDNETERNSKVRYIKRVIKKLPKPEIDDKDTDPRPFSFSDNEEERQKKKNYVKKYALRKRMKMPKYKS